MAAQELREISALSTFTDFNDHKRCISPHDETVGIRSMRLKLISRANPFSRYAALGGMLTDEGQAQKGQTLSLDLGIFTSLKVFGGLMNEQVAISHILERSQLRDPLILGYE